MDASIQLAEFTLGTPFCMEVYAADSVSLAVRFEFKVQTIKCNYGCTSENSTPATGTAAEETTEHVGEDVKKKQVVMCG